MKPLTVSKLKNELEQYSQQELVEVCLKLAKFKKENKELLTYVLIDSFDEAQYIRSIKEEIDLEFSTMNDDSLYYVKKRTRKILSLTKKYIRYSKKKETETELLLYFCAQVKQLKAAHRRSQQMINIYERQLTMAKKALGSLHEDIQYDYNLEIENLDNLS